MMEAQHAEALMVRLDWELLLFLTQVAQLAHGLGVLAFGGGVLYFSLLYWKTNSSVSPHQGLALDQRFQGQSLVMSVGLTLLIFSGLFLHFQAHGQFSWGGSSQQEKLGLAKALLFLCQWIAWGWLEVVILHPWRVALAQPEPLTSPTYLPARRRLVRALTLQLVLTVVIVCVSLAMR